MTDASEDRLSEMLADGWEIAGYSIQVLAAGAMTHSLLLRKAHELASITIVFNGAKELGRNFCQIAPMAPQKKGWF